MSTIAWKIDRVEGAPDNPEIVRKVWFSVTASDGERKVTHPYSIDLDPPDADAQVVPFDHLTEHQVIAWVKEHHDPGAPETFERLAREALDAQAPPAERPLPWAAKEAS